MERKELTPTQLKYKLSSISDVLENIETPGWINQRSPRAVNLRLDVDPQTKLRNLTRPISGIIAIKRRLNTLYSSYQASIDNLESIASEAPISPPIQEYPTPPKVFDLERRIPNLHQIIDSYLSQIDQYHITKPITGSQLTRFFPRVKATDVKKAIERGYITPERGRDRHPIYNLTEIVTLLYIRNHGNNLSPRLIKELREIIDEEIAQWDKTKKEQSEDRKTLHSNKPSSPIETKSSTQLSIEDQIRIIITSVKDRRLSYPLTPAQIKNLFPEVDLGKIGRAINRNLIGASDKGGNLGLFEKDVVYLIFVSSLKKGLTNKRANEVREIIEKESVQL